MISKPLLETNEFGIYCPIADVYIDPWQPVSKAIITHAHSDHARQGHSYYMATHTSKEILKLRLGQDIKLETLDYGQSWVINGVKFSFHPAGHIIGSAQVRVEYKGEVWVVSGDYKTETDNISEPFEVVKCHTFISESTFGLPVFQWKPQTEVFSDINKWWQENASNDITTVLCGYSLGKAQRLLKNLDHTIGKVFVHGAIANTNDALVSNGISLPPYTQITPQTTKDSFKRNLILAPPSALNSPWIKKFKPFSSGVASGWMNLRGAKKRKAVDRGFVLSDHADWSQLNQVIKETGASQVFVTHGYTAVYSKWLNEQGISAKEINTMYAGEIDDPVETS